MRSLSILLLSVLFALSLDSASSAGSPVRHWNVSRRWRTSQMWGWHPLVSELRGGALRPRKKSKASRTGSLSSKTATGKKKVGSAAKAEKERESAISSTMQKYKRILPATRFYITMVGCSTLLGLILGEELTQGLLALDPMRTIYGMQLWRLLTAASFLGPPSIGWLMSGYYLFEYGSSLERAYGTPQHFY
jgi:membrane associated rhomboid family serine protease